MWLANKSSLSLGRKKKIQDQEFNRPSIWWRSLFIACFCCVINVIEGRESKKATVRLPPTVAKGGAAGCINLFILHPGCTPSPSSPFLNGHRHIYDGIALKTGSLPDNPIASHWWYSSTWWNTHPFRPQYIGRVWLGHYSSGNMTKVCSPRAGNW